MTHDRESPDQSQQPQPRQTTAYLKELFKQVGFTIDARRGQNFLPRRWARWRARCGTA